MWMACLLLTGCSKNDDGLTPVKEGYIKATIEGQEVFMPYLAKMEEKNRIPRI